MALSEKRKRYTVTESLYVIATAPEAQEIAGYLVTEAMATGLFDTPPRLSIEPDWVDSCDLLALWSAEHDGEVKETGLPDGVGIWRIRLAFDVTCSEDVVDDIEVRRLSHVVNKTVQHVHRSESIPARSVSEGIYYFSLGGYEPV